MLAGSSVLYHLLVPVFLRDKWHRFLQSGRLSYHPPVASLFLSSEGKKTPRFAGLLSLSSPGGLQSTKPAAAAVLL